MSPESLQLQAKSQIISLLVESPIKIPKLQGKIINIQEAILSKNKIIIGKVCDILEKFPLLNKDQEVFTSILRFSKDKSAPFVTRFKEEQSKKALITFDRGIAKVQDDLDIELIKESEIARLIQSIPEGMGRFTVKNKALKISETALMSQDPEHFWKFIEDQDVQNLVIRQKDEVIAYDKKLLMQLAEKRLSMSYLTNKSTLEFEIFEKVIETNAKLVLCGKWFEAYFSERWEHKSTINFLEEISCEGFLGILHQVETGELDSNVSPEDYEQAVNFLNFVPSVPKEIPLQSQIPGAYGKEHWEKYWGNVGEVPPIPKELLEAWSGPCPILNKEKKADGPKMNDTHAVFYMPKEVDGKKLSAAGIEEIAKSDKFGQNKIGYEYFSPTVKAANPTESEGGYWFAMLKPNEEFLNKLRNKKTAEQKKYLEDNLPKEYHEFPSAIEALVYCLMPYAEKKECVLGRGEPYWTYTRCKDVVNGDHVVIGGVAASGLSVSSHDNAFSSVCVVPVRKFFRS